MSKHLLDAFDDPRAETIRRLKSWAADSREREEWGDGNRATYRYRAETLEAAWMLLAEEDEQ